MAGDLGVVQCVLDVVALTGAAVGQRDVEVDLQSLRYAFFPLVDTDEGGDFEFAQENNIHIWCEAGRLVAMAQSRKICRLTF